MRRLIVAVLGFVLISSAIADTQDDRLAFLQKFIEQDVLRSLNVDGGNATLVVGQYFDNAGDRAAMEDLARTAFQYLNGLDPSAEILQIVDADGADVGTYTATEGLHLVGD